MPLPTNIHEKIRYYRKHQKLSQADLAQYCACSISLISQIERGVVTPTYTKIKCIAEALRISPSQLMDGSGEPDLGNSVNSYHMSREDRKVLSLAKGINYELLSRNIEVPFEFIYLEYEPGIMTTRGPGINHEGVECGLLLEGELDFEVDGIVHHLKPGDTITLRSTVPHKGINNGKKTAKAIWVESIPWLFTTK